MSRDSTQRLPIYALLLLFFVTLTGTYVLIDRLGLNPIPLGSPFFPRQGYAYFLTVWTFLGGIASLVLAVALARFSRTPSAQRLRERLRLSETADATWIVAFMFAGFVIPALIRTFVLQFAALTDDQRLLCIETVVEEVAGRVPVIGNVSAPGTQLTVNLGLSVQEMGLTGIAATPPYYYPCGQDEIADHFRHISERVGLPLWAYNIPAMVKTAIEPAGLAMLGSEGRIVGIKDSSGAGEPLAQLRGGRAAGAGRLG